MGPPQSIACGLRWFASRAATHRALRTEILSASAPRRLDPDELQWVVPFLRTHPHWVIKIGLGGGWNGDVVVTPCVD